MHHFLLLFIITVLAEIYLLFYTSNSIGIINTMLIIMITAIIGITMLRLNGFLTFNKIREQFSQGNITCTPLLEGFITSIASILLIIPGLCSDLIGILCLIPPFRSHLTHIILSKIKPFPITENRENNTIEGTFSEQPAEQKQLK